MEVSYVKLPRSKRMTKKQKELLVKYLECNKELVHPLKSSSIPAEVYNKKWEELTNVLNSDHIGPEKTTRMWKEAVSDLKSNLKRHNRLKDFSQAEEKLIYLVNTVNPLDPLGSPRIWQPEQDCTLPDNTVISFEEDQIVEIIKGEPVFESDNVCSSSTQRLEPQQLQSTELPTLIHMSESSNNVGLQTPCDLQQNRKRRYTSDHIDLAKNEPQKSNVEPDDVDHFFNYIKSETKKFKTEGKDFIKKEVFKIIFQAKANFD